jgi:glutamate-1-semialdehyde 2,1-aminomutase
VSEITDARPAGAGSGQSLYAKAKRLIPGGTQLLSKRPEMFLPDQWPSYYSRAEGARVWDLDGRPYVDMSYSGVGACILGYADPDVDGAVRSAVDRGTMTTLNCPEEVELAELLIELHPWAEKVRYARTGGEAMAVAVRIARAATGRDKIAFCGYHGWHDWYLAANLGDGNALDGHLLPGLEPAGVPRGLRGTMLPFHYNRAEELEAIAVEHGAGIGAMVMEPVRSREPAPGFLERARAIATEIGAALVFDEVSAGWRLTSGGAHLLYGVRPDIAVFSKGMSNGYPMAAIVGTAAVMDAAQDSFISSTYWTERIGPVAALATIAKHRRLDVADHLVDVGGRVQEGWREAADRHGLDVEVSGIAPLGHFEFRCEKGQAVRTLFTQLMLERAFLATNAFYAMFAHQHEQVESYLGAVDEVFQILAKVVREESVERMLKGPVAHKGFARLT